MRKQIAAANWKMNGNAHQAEILLKEVLEPKITLNDDQFVIFAVPFPFLQQASHQLGNTKNYFTIIRVENRPLEETGRKTNAGVRFHWLLKCGYNLQTHLLMKIQ